MGNLAAIICMVAIIGDALPLAAGLAQAQCLALHYHLITGKLLRYAMI